MPESKDFIGWLTGEKHADHDQSAHGRRRGGEFMRPGMERDFIADLVSALEV